MRRFLLLTLSFMTLFACNKTPKDRAIPFEGIDNGRELGGLVMADGRTVRHGMLVRSGNLSKATDGDVAILRDRFHLSDVFDFRFDAEVLGEPDREMENVRNTHLSTLPQKLIDGFSSGRTDTTKIQSRDMLEALAKYSFLPQAQQMAQQLYPAIVMDTTSQRRYGAFLRGVLEAEGGVLWHCSQGKDRAGWGTAFVLAALGASRETIEADFALSNQSYAGAVEKVSAKVREMGGSENELAFIRAMVGVSEENFSNTLDLIQAQYGSLSGYLEKALGFSAADQERMRKRYLKR